MLRLLRYLLFLAVLLAVGTPIVLLMAGLQDEPLVTMSGEPTTNDIARAKSLLKKLDPRGQDGDQPRTIEVPERDLALGIGYAVSRFAPAAAEVDLHPGSASVALSAQMPENPLGRYLNLRLALSQVAGGIELAGLQFGDLDAPTPIARGVGWLTRRALQADETLGTVLAGVNGYRMTEDRLVVVYQWQPDLVDRMKSRGRALLVDEADRERLLAYSERIAASTRKPRITGKLPLPELLQPVFETARERTGASGDAAAESRAAIIAMMLYAQGVDVARLLNEPADPRYRPKARALTLQGRTDFAQHFLISAGVATAGGSRLADAIGLFKELGDSRGGSGFSFTDLAANRAGVRFAETATGARAAKVQRVLASKPEESQFMPSVKDLPEFLREEDFVQRFGGVGTRRYNDVADEIERRIGALPIHRGSQ